MARHPLAVLGGIAVLYAAVQLVVVRHPVAFAWDEAIYVTEVSPEHDPIYFAPTRARGISFLVAPLVVITGSLTALRVFLTVASAGGLFLAFWPWVRIRPGAGLAAAALFSTTWVAVFYGSQVSPNLFSALAAVAVAGLFVLALDSPGTRRLEWGVAGAAALVGLFRPYDLSTLGLGLGLGTLGFAGRGDPAGSWGARLARLTWRHPARRALTALGIGGLAGWTPWLIDSTRFGGPAAALRRAVIETSGGSGTAGWGFHLTSHLAATDGPVVLYNPIPQPIPWGGAVWWASWLLVGVAGVALAAKASRRPAGIALVAGLSAFAGYVFITPMAPRFLLPSYGLIAVATGFGLAELAGRARRRRMIPMVGLFSAVAVFGVVLAWQLAAGSAFLAQERTKRERFEVLGAIVAEQAHGAECWVWSELGHPQVELASGCRGRRLDPHAPEPTALMVAKAEELGVVYLLALSTPDRDSFLRGLPNMPLPIEDSRDWDLYVFSNDDP